MEVQLYYYYYFDYYRKFRHRVYARLQMLASHLLSAGCLSALFFLSHTIYRAILITSDENFSIFVKSFFNSWNFEIGEISATLG